MLDIPDAVLKAIESQKYEFSDRLLAWWKQNRRDYPWRRPDVTPYEVLLAEVLLRRTTSTAASRSFLVLVNKYPDIYALAGANVSELESYLSCIGLQRQRSIALKEISLYICEHYNGQIPCDINLLLKVPHIGPYIGRAILSFSYGVPVGVVDSNVIRVIKRLFYALLPPKFGINLIQTIVDKLLPLNQHREFNWALLDFGAVICRYVRPRCIDCVFMKAHICLGSV